MDRAHEGGQPKGRLPESDSDQPASFHACSAEVVALALESDLQRGLSKDAALARLAQVGPNALPEAPPASLWHVFLHQFQSPLVYLLLGAAAVAFTLSHLSDAIVIIVVVLLNSAIGTFQEGRAERSLSALRSLVQQHARIIRGGQELELLAREVVPGDLLIVQAGDAIVADARIVESAQLSVAEAALTGESVPVTKSAEPVSKTARLADRTSVLYAGTHVSAGRARALIVATGTHTEIGKIAHLAQSGARQKTPLELRIARFGRTLSYAALLVFVLIGVVGTLRGLPLSDLLMVGISQVVGLIPEGLPVAMTIALSIGVTRMAKRGAIVRKLSAVETLGSTTVIASDKTGTLTRNEMTVTRLFMPDGSEIAVEGIGYDAIGALRLGTSQPTAQTDAALRALLEASVLCNDATFAVSESKSAARTPLGDPTEAALVVLAEKGGLDVSALRAAYPRTVEVPFDSTKKWMATEHMREDTPFIVLKGAPEVVLRFCVQDQSVVGADRAAQRMADAALRVIAFACIDDGKLLDGGRLPKAARFLGLAGQLDPPREQVAEAVQRCKRAGIRPVMITGDHKATGMAIANALSMTSSGREALDGVELARMQDEELLEHLPRVDVFARVEPAQKLRIVQLYQRRGEVVAMTGDGVNDAPALVRADVGVAMGMTGTEVAKQAARIIVTDDNFATIVAAVEEGRLVYANLQKALLLLLSTSLAEVIVLTGALLAGLPPPFAAVQILWNNLITEGLTTVNLVMEPPEGNEMDRPPISSAEGLISPALRRRLFLLTPTIALLSLGWFALRLAQNVSFATVQTETFTLLAVCEWFNVLNCRSSVKSAFGLSLGRNPSLFIGMLAGIALQAAVLYIPALQRVFYTQALGLRQLVAIACVASCVLWVEELRKLFARRSARTSVLRGVAS